MNTKSYYPVLLAVFMIGSVVSQNVDELPISVETDNLFPPERSESNSQNKDSEITTAEPTQETSDIYTKTDVATSTLTTEDEKIVASTDLPPESPVEDVVSSTIMSDNEKDNDNQDTETTVADANQTMSGTTITDFLIPTLTNDDAVPNDGGSETNSSKPHPATLGSTMLDAKASTSAEELVTTTALPNDGSSAINEADSLEPAFSGVMQISDDANSESTSAETKSTQTTLGFSTDVDEPALQNEEKVTTNVVSETTAAETTQTSGSTITAEASTTLAITDEQNAITDNSETTTMENADLKSGSTIADMFTSSLTASDDQFTNNEGSETMTESPNEVADFSISMNAEEQATTATSLELSCPKSCMCITEGDSSDYIVDCSDRALSDLPGPIDPKTTTLKLQNNVLTIIPKEISQLKNLKVLNASDNLIFELELGSVSELPELVTLNIANNRLHEYPEDLQRPLALNKLEELNLAGNDLIATPKNLLNYKALQTVTLPEASSELAAELCISLKDTLVTVCSKSCEEQSFKCLDAFIQTSDTLPGMIPFIPRMMNEDTKNADDISGNTSDRSITSPVPESTEALNTAAKDAKSGLKENAPVNEFSLRTAVNNAPDEKVALQNIVIDTPKDSTNNETDVNVGAKTTETKAAGGVDKSVIAVIVAGMVIIIAIITIKKNWSSIRNRFGSTPRPNDRSVRNTNGTTPEEVPLQDKSPV